jgi:tetratricopeptide (TPR) repeat protein
MSNTERHEPALVRRSSDLAASQVAEDRRLRTPAPIEDFRQRWRLGERMTVEAYLQQFRPTGVDDVELLDLIYHEIVLREEDGESPRLEDYLARFPAHHEALCAQFEIHRFLQTAMEPAAHTFDPYWPHVEGYDILNMLGKGGMGTVYRAFDRKRRRPVALKTLHCVGANALLRFKQEFRNFLHVAHPNLVTLFELICDGQSWFLTMELLDGVDFLQYVRPVAAGSVDYGRLRAAMRQLAQGAAALHSAAKLHRDLKPSNVIVTPAGRLVLVDFGLAAEWDDSGEHMSTAEHVVGTVAYMAPEQAAKLPVSAASDWYSVGVMLFEALTGRRPFSGNALSVLLDKQRFDAPAPSDVAADVPEDLNALCIDLLRRRPEERPSQGEILGRLKIGGPADLDRAIEVSAERLSASTSACAPGPRSALVGRKRHLEALAAALDAVRRGRTVALYLHGPSGVGKTALLQGFLDEQFERGDIVVLTGRCYEHESVPYKALDSLIDALGRYLARLPTAEAAAVLPRHAGALARVFPSLVRCEAVLQSQYRDLTSPDPQELRRRAFSALRELFARLGDRAPVVVAIDDLQWGDADSAAMVAGLLRPPDAPVLLFLGTYRSEDRATSPFLQAIFDAERIARDEKKAGVTRPELDCRELAVDLLGQDEASALAMELLGKLGRPSSLEHSRLVESIARESGGNPFFVTELVRHVHAHARERAWAMAGPGADLTTEPKPEPTKLALEEVLWSRIKRLPDEARRVLELVAISGRPLRLVELSDCAELAQDERVALAALHAGRLIRSTGRTETDEVETYHDRVRETVVAHLDPERARLLHLRLAFVLEASGQTDPEVLGLHFLSAHLPERAVDLFVEAAGRAAEMLAFERAAALYRRALAHLPEQSRRGPNLRMGLGDALANAGRGAEAARAYLDAVPAAAPELALELQRRAALQYLKSGHIDLGLAILQTVLATVGMSLPRTPLRSLASLLWRRGLLRLRRLRFRERPPDEIRAADLARIDVCWSAAVGLSVVDTIRGADFQARCLLVSLAAGEPSRIARSLALEAAHRASTGGSNRKGRSLLLQAAEELASRAPDAYPLAMVTLARGVVAYLEGEWRDARENCDRAEMIFRDNCTGVTWELDTANAFALWALSHLGEIAELGRRWPILLAQARERGDLYAAINLSSYLMSVVRLAADDPDRARLELRENMAHWSQSGYHVQHNDALWAGVQIELYCGAGQCAWNLIRQAWPALERSLLLRVQFIRTSMYFLRARAALAAAAELRNSSPAVAHTLLSGSARAARRLEREKMPCPAAYARMIRGGLAALHGDLPHAALRLGEAVDLFEAVDMRLCAVSVRRRLGELTGGDSGQEAIGRADQWMRDQKIQNPARMAAMIVPRLN